MAFRGAAALGSSEHKVLFTGNATASHKCDEEKQAKKRTGESSGRHCVYSNTKRAMREDQFRWLGFTSMWPQLCTSPLLRNVPRSRLGGSGRITRWQAFFGQKYA